MSSCMHDLFTATSPYANATNKFLLELYFLITIWSYVSGNTAVPKLYVFFGFFFVFFNLICEKKWTQENGICLAVISRAAFLRSN